MRLTDIESKGYLREENLTSQQISNLFAGVISVVSRNRMGTNRTLLGKVVDRLKPNEKNREIENAYKNLENQLKFSTANPAVGPELDSIVKEIKKKTSNDPFIVQKFQDYNNIMLTKPKIQKFMIDLANTINALVDRGFDIGDIKPLLDRIDQLIEKTPLQMGRPQQTQPAASSAPAAEPAAVTEGIFDLNKISREKLIALWQNAGRPVDSGKILNILKNAGVGEDQAIEAFQIANIPYPSGSTATQQTSQPRVSTRGTTTANRPSGTTTANRPSRSTTHKPFKTVDSAQNAFDDYISRLINLNSKDVKRLVDYIKNSNLIKNQTL